MIGTGYENGELVPVAEPAAMEPEEDREAALRQFLATALEALFTRLLRRSLDPVAAGRRVYALAFAAKHHSVAEMTAEQLAKRLGVSAQRFYVMVQEVSKEWGIRAPERRTVEQRRIGRNEYDSV